jgi:murein L,D-transpeptidase YcbB/YkuD
MRRNQEMRSLLPILLCLFIALPEQTRECAAEALPIAAPSPAAGGAVAAQRLPMEALRTLLLSRTFPLPQIAGENLSQVKGFYASEAYAPLWVSPTGLDPKGMMLLTRLRMVEAAGVPALAQLLTEAENRGRASSGQPLAELELLLSAAFLQAAIDPNDPAATARSPAGLLQAAVNPKIMLSLRSYLPADPAFWRLRGAIEKYRLLEAGGGWPVIPPGPKLELGAIGPTVETLRRRLLATGDLIESGPKADEFDIALHAAVSHFQARHGLQVDGVVGMNTLEALNIPVAARIDTLELNLRRLQRQHREWGQRYVVVNTAAASYRLVDGGQTLFEHVAIVGRRDWPTPQLDGVIDRLEFNPYWIVPPRIARLEVLPKIRRDPDYMAANDFHWVDGQIRQDPGAKNPLGKVKFLFPNPYDVYLHDTNSPKLFDRWDRHLSHGCMRIPNALDFAAYLLKDDPQWPPQRIDAVLQSGQVVRLALPAPIPVHVVYDTAWVDSAGVVNFRPDIYGRDDFAE